MTDSPPTKCTMKMIHTSIAKHCSVVHCSPIKGELHCVVSHNVNFVGQKIRQLELWNLAQWEICSLVPGTVLWKKLVRRPMYRDLIDLLVGTYVTSLKAPLPLNFREKGWNHIFRWPPLNTWGHCRIVRCLTMKSFWIHPSRSNFVCVTQTKRIGPLELKLHEFFRSRKLKLLPWTFVHPFFRPFLWNTSRNQS